MAIFLGLFLARASAYFRVASAVSVSIFFSSGCIYDDADRCGPNQELSGTQACVCKDGLVLVGTSCVPCPEHELEVDGACQCETGYARPAEGQACALVIVGGQGVSCSASQPCVDDVFNVCEPGGVQGSYCTKLGCGSDADCDMGYGCHGEGAAAFCERPPLGLGNACSTDADCETGDATFCDAYVSQRCLVSNCSLENNDCFAGMECCDLSQVGIPGLPSTVCAPLGRCP